MQGKAVQQKIGERYRQPLYLWKYAGLQGQGSAAKNWRALPLGGYPAILGKNAEAGQCSKKLVSATLGGYPSIFGKNAGGGQCSKKLASATAGGLPLYLWEKCKGRAVQ